MIFHAIPKIYNPYSDVGIKLVDVSIPEIELTLSEGVDLAVRKPYPNKCLEVACRKKGRKAIEGFFVDLPSNIDQWSVVTCWAESEKTLLVHEVNYKLLDSDFGCVTDSVIMWGKFNSHSLGFWENRHPDDNRNTVPINLQPQMEVLFNSEKTNRDANIEDHYSASGQLILRKEIFAVPTIELERLTSRSLLNDRMPSIEDAFAA